MGRLYQHTSVNFYLVNFVELEKALKIRNDNNYEKIISSLHDHVVFKRGRCIVPYFISRVISNVGENLVLFDSGEEYSMSDLFGNSFTNSNIECYADYQMFSNSDEKKYNLIYEIFNKSILHPVYLFRYAELCQFELSINDDLLLRVFGDRFKNQLSDDEDAPPKKKSTKSTNINDYNRKLLKIIKNELVRPKWDEDLLESYRKVLHLINTTSSENDIYTGNLDLRQLQYDYVLIIYIIEFIGDVKTLFNFSITNRTFYELFKQTNYKNLLLKRIVKDWGLISIAANLVK